MKRRIWFDADGGDGGNGNGDGKKPEGKEPPEDKKPPEAKFTQEDMDRVAGERARRAEEATQKKLLESLGVKDPDEAKKLLEDARKAREQQMSDLDKAKAEAEQFKADKAKAEQERAEAIEKATVTLMRAAVLAEASKADYRFKPEALGDVWAFVDRAGIKPKDGADGEFTGISEALKALVKAKPYLVETGSRLGTPRTGAGGKSGKEGDDKELAVQLARQYKSSF